MKKYLFLLMGVIFLASSCQDDRRSGDNSLGYNEDELLKLCINSFNHYAAEEWTLPATVKSNGNPVTKTIIFQNSSGTAAIVPNQGYCGAFTPPLQFVIEGSGIATHIGLFTVSNLACVDVSGNFLSPLYGFITAANGDEIHTQMGMPYPDLDNPPNIFYPYTIIGGTGRFENATGELLMHGISDFVTMTWSLTGEGEITY